VRLVLVLVLIAALGAAAIGVARSTSASAAASANTAHPVMFAIADDAAQRAFPSELGSARGVGIGAARAYVSWADAAPTRPARPREPADPAYRWAQTDADIARYGNAGLAVWIAFWRTPAWASGSSDTAVWPQSAKDLDDFAFAVARRYPQVGVFMDWNEPNVKGYAKPNTIQAYEPMARAIYAGVKAASPSAVVIAGNLARYRDNGRDPVAWATALRNDHVPMDALGIHPYPDVTKPLAARAPRSRIDLFDVPALARLAGVPVAVTEFGWSSQLAGAANQAGWTAQAIDVARCTPGLDRFVFWGYHDHPVPAGQTPDPWVTYGWLDASGAPKQVYAAASAALAGAPDCGALAQAAGAPAGWPDTNTISPTDIAPSCTDATLSTVSGASVAGDLACTDAEDDRLSYAATTPPVSGTLSRAGSLFTYTPPEAFVGSDTFTVMASDGIESSLFRVTVSVHAPPEAPVATPADAPLAAVAALPLALVPAATTTVARVGGRASVSNGRVSLAFSCPSGATTCRGDVGLSATLEGVRRSLGAGIATIAPGTTRSLAFSIPAAAGKALRRRAGTTISLEVRFTAGAGQLSRTTLRLHVPR
jgi:hypothetical protein